MNAGLTMLSHLLGATFWLPDNASTAADLHDQTWNFIYAVVVFFFILVVALMIYFGVKYRRRGRDINIAEIQKVATHNTPLEVIWTAIPLLLVLVMFVMGFSSFVKITTQPSDAETVNVVAMKWSWGFTYNNGASSDELHVPLGQPIALQMTSPDVTHGFFVPAFRLQRNVVPGRMNFIWFTATREGTYDLYCTQYCGTEHSRMVAKVIVQKPEEYAAWKVQQADIWTDPKTKQPRALAEVGRTLYQQKGCAGCHTIDGSRLTGPSWKNIIGYNVPLEGGKDVDLEVHGDAAATAKLSHEYLRESILNPSAKVVKGYSNVMPSYDGQLDDRKIDAIVAYINTLTDKPNPELTKAAEAALKPAATQPAVQK